MGYWGGMSVLACLGLIEWSGHIGPSSSQAIEILAYGFIYLMFVLEERYLDKFHSWFPRMILKKLFLCWRQATSH